MSTFSKDDPLNRYLPQILLPQIGIQGQYQLREAKISCIGAGALGCSALLYLTGAGIGHIQICDNDEVSLSNLHRQILYTEKDVGKNKSQVASMHLKARNSQVNFQTIPKFINEHNVLSIINESDIIIDATDNFKSKFLLNDACHYLNKPLVTASITQFSGQCAVISSPTTPCLRCVYEFDNMVLSQNCNEGVLGMLPGIFGMLQAVEVIKFILNFPSSLLGKWWQWGILQGNPREFSLSFSPNCPLCTAFNNSATLAKKTQLTLKNTIERVNNMINPGITVRELATKLANHEDLFLLDVRNPDEYAHFNLGGHLCPLAELPQRVNEIPHDKPIIVYCRSGHRSQTAVDFLQSCGFTNLQNLIGGVLAWQKEVI